MDKITTAHSEIWEEDGILSVRMLDEVSGEEIETLFEKGNEFSITKGGLPKLLINISGIKNFPKAAMSSAFKNFNSSYFSAPNEKVALVCEDQVSRILASFFLKIYRPKIGIRIFTDTDSAKKWLEEDANIK
jgi:hypothetical protein